MQETEQVKPTPAPEEQQKYERTNKEPGSDESGQRVRKLEKATICQRSGGGGGPLKGPLSTARGGQGVDQKCGFHTSQGSRGPHGLEAQGPRKDDKGLKITTQVVPIRSQLPPQVRVALDEGPRFSEDVHIALLKGA